MVQQHGVFVVEVQAALIEVGGAHHGCLVIAQAHFGVDEAGLILIDLDAALDEGLVIGAADHVDIPFIRVGGGDDADIHAAFRRGFQGGDKFIIQDEVGCGDIDIMVRPLDEVQIGILRHIKVIQMYSSARLMPPVKPTWPSMTQILRWSR